MKIAPKDLPHWQFQPGLVGWLRRRANWIEDLHDSPDTKVPDWWMEVEDWTGREIHKVACAIEGCHPYDNRPGSPEHYCCFCHRSLN